MIAESRSASSSVSIHVPARGTTYKGYRGTIDYCVSIHVPARGTTFFLAMTCHRLYSFNPRSRKGNDFTGAGKLRCKTGFNPRSRKGNDDLAVRILAVYRCFNPRSRKGNDAGRRSCSPRSQRFQSTFPQGERRLRAHVLFFVSCVSIHVPARGTTSVDVPTTHFCGFQSTFPQGERPRDQIRSRSFVLFQSTFPQGERRVSCIYFRQIYWFQSTFPQGERRNSAC